MQNREYCKLKIVQYLESDAGRNWIDDIDSAASDDAEFDKRATRGTSNQINQQPEVVQHKRCRGINTLSPLLAP